MEQLKAKKKLFIFEMFSNISKGFSYGIDDEENPSLPRDNTKNIEKEHLNSIEESIVSNKKSKGNGTSSYKKTLKVEKAKVTPLISEDELEIEDLNKIKQAEVGEED